MNFMPNRMLSPNFSKLNQMCYNLIKDNLLLAHCNYKIMHLIIIKAARLNA